MSTPLSAQLHATPGELHRAGSVALHADASRLPPSLAHHVANTAALRAQLASEALLPSANAQGRSAFHDAHSKGARAPTVSAFGTVLQLLARPRQYGSRRRHDGAYCAARYGSAAGLGAAASRCATLHTACSHASDSSISEDDNSSCASKDCERHGAMTDAHPTMGETFLETYSQELSRLRRLLTCSLEGLWWRADRGAERLQRAFAALRLARQQAGQQQPQQQEAEVAASLATVCAELRAECDNIGTELLDLEAFECFNSAELSGLALQYDICTMHMYGSTALPATTASTCPLPAALAAAVSGDRLAALEAKREYQRAVQDLVLGGLTYDTVLVAMSDLYDAVRQAEEAASSQGQAAGAGEAWVPPDEFKRSTTKFWVDPRDVLRVKTAIVRHLPVLIFGRRLPTLDTTSGSSFSDEDTAPPSSLPHLFRELADGSPISSVYLDTPELAVYHDRLARNDGASLVRVRWYGPEPGPDDNVYVERKVHREKWTGEQSTKDRATLPARDVPPFLAGRAVPALAPLAAQQDSAQPQRGGKALRAAALLADVQRDLTHRKQEPHVRTVYRRTAFQLSSTNAVRISIDSHMSLVREAAAPRRQGGWCRDMSQPVHRDDVIHFPYAVLEIKLEDEEAAPEWVTALRSSGLLVPAGKFSKFSHGMALLFPQRVQRTPEWFAEEGPGPGSGGLSPVTLQEMAIMTGAREADREQQRREEAAAMAAVVGELEQQRGQQQALPPTPFSVAMAPAHTAVVIPPYGGAKAQEPHAATGRLLPNGCNHSAGPTHGPLLWFTAKREALRQWCSPCSHTAGKADVEAGGKAAAPAAGYMLPRGGVRANMRIEPKVFFAAERTFLSWLQISVLIMLTALSLLASGGGGAVAAGASAASSCGTACHASRVAGMAMAPVALLFMLYALWMYRRRSAQMLQRQAVRYDDQWGPVLLTGTLIGVFITAYALAIEAV